VTVAGKKTSVAVTTVTAQQNGELGVVPVAPVAGSVPGSMGKISALLLA
jgi:hypothetical protein